MLSIIVGLVLTLFCIGEIINAAPDEHKTNLEKQYKKEFLFYPDGKGDPQVMLLVTPPSDKKLTTDFIEENIQFIYYPRKTMKSVTFRFNSKKKIEENNPISEIIKNFNAVEELKVVIHGYKSSANHNMTKQMKDAYLNNFFDVITVDWKNLINSTFYKDCVNNTQTVGKYLAKFLDLLVDSSAITASNFHLIGHDFGAHVAAYAGKFLKTGKLARITGLDPARLLYETETTYLDKTNADFVDIIHTTTSHGYKKPIGHIDFYPNNGEAFQPGCKGLKETFHCCSHLRAYQYFTESIVSSVGFYGYKCDNYKKFILGHCTMRPVQMGEYTSKSDRGIYYVETNSQTPFALGKLDCIP